MVVRVRPPPVPVTVTVAAPSVAVLDAVKVSVLLPPVVDDGLKLAVTPLGGFVAFLLQGLSDPIYATAVTYSGCWFLIGTGSAG